MHSNLREQKILTDSVLNAWKPVSYEFDHVIQAVGKVTS